MIVLLIAGFSARCVEEEQQVTSTGEFYNASRYEEQMYAIMKQRNFAPSQNIDHKDLSDNRSGE